MLAKFKGTSKPRRSEMAWESVEWSCGHTGSMQLYGKMSERASRTAYEAGRKCMVCWLIDRWEQTKDPRSSREDKYQLAADIAAAKGRRIDLESLISSSKLYEISICFS